MQEPTLFRAPGNFYSEDIRRAKQGQVSKVQVIYSHRIRSHELKMYVATGNKDNHAWEHHLNNNRWDKG